MPPKFEKCVKKGGKVRTEKLPGGKYRAVCIIAGKFYAGHTKTKKK